MGSNEVSLHHLQYADDTIFLGEWNLRNAKNLMRIMNCMKDALGLKVNRNKSKVFSIGVSEWKVADLVRGMGCVPGKLPFVYLRVPIGLNMRKKENWDTIVDKFKNKLSSWKAKTISYGGHLTLVKSVLGSVPI